MDINQTVEVKAQLRDVAEYMAAYLVAPPAEGTLAKAQLDELGIDYATIAPSIEVTKVNSRHFRASATVMGVPTTSDYRLKATPTGTEIAITSSIDLDATVAASLKLVRDMVVAEGDAAELAEFEEFAAQLAPQLRSAAEQSARDGVGTQLADWANHFPAFIAAQKALHKGGPSDGLAA